MTRPTRRNIVLSTLAASAGAAIPLSAEASPLPQGATPSARQLAWHRRQAQAFIHFSINTFTDREWGYGDESPALFNPTDFSADQIVESAQSAGLAGLILTAKHHDGFCLWPSRYTDHSIKSSPYKDGHGDIVGEMAEACRRHGMRFGIYLSPWDRNHPEYGRPAYVEYYHAQLEELTTQYGPLVEVWFDGANGGDGFYGGARELRKIDGHTYYQWDKVREIVRRNQPSAVMFADSDMDIRWVGNEEGVAGETCWPTWDYTTPYSLEKANNGVKGGPIWNPAEADVSIRPGWFWHSDEAPRSAINLTRLWFESVGRGANLLLNLPPDRRGRIPDEDRAALKDWKAIRDRAFTTNLAAAATVTASSTFSPAFAAKRILSADGAWAAAAKDAAGAWFSVELPAAVSFDVIRLAEDIRYGVRVDTFAVEARTAAGWQEVARTSAIGNERLIRLDHPVTAAQVRVRILSAFAAPVLRNFGLFRLPDLIEEPTIRRDAQGMVTLSAPVKGLDLHYTTDGSTPDATSPEYTAPFDLREGGTVRVIAVKPASDATSAVVSRDFDIAPARWRITTGDSAIPFDPQGGAPLTGAPGQPLDITIDLGQTYPLKGFTLTPAVQTINVSVDKAAQLGSPAGYEAWLSLDGKDWGKSGAQGEFSNIAASRAEQKIRFPTTQPARYLRLHFPRAVQDKTTIIIGAIGVITR